MFSDSSGNIPQSVFEKWISSPSNLFNLIATSIYTTNIGVLASQASQIVKATRHHSVPIGRWNNIKTQELNGLQNKASKFGKVSLALALITSAIQVGEGIYTDINRGYSTDRILSNAVVNTVIYGGSTLGLGFIGGKIGAAVGSFIPVPIVGTVIGTAVGYVIGIGFGFLLELNVGGKTVIDHVRDGVYDFWDSLFN